MASLLRWDTRRLLRDATDARLSYQEWATKAGVSVRTVYRLSAGDMIGRASLTLLAYALGRKPSDYLVVR